MVHGSPVARALHSSSRPSTTTIDDLASNRVTPHVVLLAELVERAGVESPLGVVGRFRTVICITNSR